MHAAIDNFLSTTILYLNLVTLARNVYCPVRSDTGIIFLIGLINLTLNVNIGTTVKMQIKYRIVFCFSSLTDIMEIIPIK